jgi:hypothetical protein
VIGHEYKFSLFMVPLLFYPDYSIYRFGNLHICVIFPEL